MKHTYTRFQSTRMMQCLLTTLFLGLLVSACSLPGGNNTPAQQTPSACATPGTGFTQSSLLASQPPGIVKIFGGSPLPGNLVKSLVFNLSYNDTAMERDLLQIYTPGSPTYHHFLTPDTIVHCYALSDAQIKQVQQWLTGQGYQVDSIDPLRSAIRVQGTVSTIEKSLNLQLNQYRLPIFGSTFFMQDHAPTLPSSIRPFVQSIVGLDNVAIPNIKLPIGGFATQRAQFTASGGCVGYGARQTLTRDKLAGAYQLNRLYGQNVQGQGMTIGVAEFGDSYSPQDIAAYAACVGIPTPSIQNIDVDGHLPAGPGEGEATMDLELIAGLVPGAHILDYQADIKSTSFIQSLVDVFNRVAADHSVQVLSVSYGSGEDMFSTSEEAAVARSLRNLAAEGISVFISSGDCGAYSQRIRNLAVVSFPASAPYAIAVGGTHLLVNNQNVRISETGWGNADGAFLCQNEWGSGGGVSENKEFVKPAWQVGPGMNTQYNGSSAHVVTADGTAVKAPNGLRQVPDVAAAAYPNIAIYYQGQWLAAGGTSAAAPIWAAGTLLVDQTLQQKGKAYIGGVPEFYTLANHPGSFHPFNNITSGNNLFYSATPGWNYVTGWGSPNFFDITQLALTQ
jgi:kumamolisin